MKKIGIDLDTTLNNLEEKWVKEYNKDYHDNLKEFDRWDTENTVKPECGTKIFDYLHKPGFFRDLEIKPNAKNVVDFLSEHYELYIVTAYSPDTCLDKANWVKDKDIAIDQRNIIFINNKNLLKLDYLIDDGPHNIENFKNGTPIIFDMPYNRYLNSKEYPYRYNNWLQIKEFFSNKISKKID